MKRGIFLIVIILCISCNMNKKNVLLNYQKKISEDYPEYYESCLKWKLDSLDIMEILRFSETTDFFEIDVRYSTVPCEYIGEAIINGDHCKFWINGGGYTTILSNEETSYLVYRKENNFFLEKPWDPEKENK